MTTPRCCGTGNPVGTYSFTYPETRARDAVLGTVTASDLDVRDGQLQHHRRRPDRLV